MIRHRFDSLFRLVAIKNYFRYIVTLTSVCLLDGEIIVFYLLKRKRLASIIFFIQINLDTFPYVKPGRMVYQVDDNILCLNFFRFSSFFLKMSKQKTQDFMSFEIRPNQINLHI